MKILLIDNARGGINMATCSITDRIVINNPEFVDAYIDAMEARANAPFKPRTEDQKSAMLTDPEEIRRILELCLAKVRDKHSG